MTGQINDLIGRRGQIARRPDLRDETIDSEEATINDLRTAVIHRYENLCVPDEKSAHGKNVPKNAVPRTRPWTAHRR